MDGTVDAIVAEHLSKTYPKGVRAVEDVSFRVAPGEIFGLLGPNGAGKSTTVRMLATLTKPDGGTGSVAGHDIRRDPAGVRRALGYVAQASGVDKHATGRENLTLQAQLHRVPRSEIRQRVDRVLEWVGLTDAADRMVQTYSGGMKQRLGIAQALLGDPDLLVVDEPTAGLDPEERIRFRNLLVRISGRRTVLLSTHIVADVEASCTGLAVLRQGRLAFAGTPEELVERARGRVWLVEVEPGEWDEVASRVQVVSSRTVGGRVQLRVVADENPLGRGVPVEPGLEDGYLAVSGSAQREEWLVHV